MSTVRLECRGCERSYEYEPAAGRPAYPDACPGCEGTDLHKGVPHADGSKTGTYRYIIALGGVAKVSDGIPAIRGANATRKVPAGAKCANKGGNCGC